MQIDYRENFGDLLTSLGLFGNGIEIGVAEGKYSEILLKTSKLNKIYLLDSWYHFDSIEYRDITNEPQEIQDKRYKQVVEKMKPYGERVEIIKGDSRTEFNRFSDGFFDFIYIDANHKYEFIKQDICNWYSKVKMGGIFAGHDYMDGIKRTGEYGVKTAVNEFCKSLNIIPLVTKGSRRCPPSWYFIKPQNHKDIT